jgi:crotonobetainyl-CoA:carnitine CoA-transferase CaiB-like acyl-CoA transferase
VDEARQDLGLEPLAGIAVLRLGTSRAGDFLCRLLGDQGASLCQGKGDIRDAARHARIVIDDLGRGNAPPAGLDFDSLGKANPDLIYCALVGFPEGGPGDRGQLHDAPIASALGLHRRAGDEPREEPLPVASCFGAILAAIYIGCALLPRVGQGRGPQRIEVPLFAAGLNVISRELVTIEDERYVDPSRNNPRLPVSELYECADGNFLQPHGMYGKFARIICEVAGHPEWGDEASAGVVCLPQRSDVEKWRQRFRDLYKQRPAAEWEDLINKAGGAATVVRRHGEWTANAHAQASGMIGKDPATGRPRVGAGVVVRANPGAVATKPRPATVFSDNRLPLAGLRVVDFCIVIAGPTCGRVLADLGAEVVKIDAPDREIGPYLWLDVNRGKRSLVLDLKTQAAKEIATKLVASADVVLENFRQSKIAAFGFGYDALTRARPDLIYASLNAYDHEGPWAGRPGWEHNAQAASGMQWGRARGNKPELVPFPVNDYATGLLGALGVVMALVRRDLRGIGSHVRASLSRSATFIQMEMLEGRTDRAASEPRTRFFKCSDGWVGAYVMPNEASDKAAALESIGAAAASSSRKETIEALARQGIPAAIERRSRDLLEDRWMTEQGLLVRWQHPSLGMVMQATPKARASGFEASQRFPAPEPGASGDEVLAEHGYGGKLDSLVASGAVRPRLPLFKQTRS